MAELSLDALIAALHDQGDSDLGALRFTTHYEPAAGRGAKVFPPTYPMDQRQSPYVFEDRYDDEGNEISTVLLDSYAAQANLAEQALLDAVDGGRIELPLLVVETTVHGRPVRLTSLDMPHRCSDAYLRDSQTVDGIPFDDTDLGKGLRAATLRNATVVYRACPTALLLGTWDSHRGRPELSFKVPRAYTSEVFGVAPKEGFRVGSRLDPLGMLGGKVRRGEQPGDWELIQIVGEETVEVVKGAPKAKDSETIGLSKVGHGNVPPSVNSGGVAISRAYRCAAISLGGLRRLRFPIDGQQDAARDAAARAVIAALGVLGDRLAFGRADLALRSGCDLVVTEDRVELVQRGSNCARIDVSIDAAVQLFGAAVERAAEHGLTWDTTPVVLSPRDNLQTALEHNLIEV